MNFFLRYFEKKVAFSRILHIKRGENRTNKTIKSIQDNELMPI